MTDLYQYYAIEVENLDYKISFSVGYDEEKKEYYMPSISIKNHSCNKQDFNYDNPEYVKDLYLEFATTKDKKIKELKNDLKEIEIKPSKQILSEIHAILELAYQKGLLDLKI